MGRNQIRQSVYDNKLDRPKKKKEKKNQSANELRLYLFWLKTFFFPQNLAFYNQLFGMGKIEINPPTPKKKVFVISWWKQA